MLYSIWVTNNCNLKCRYCYVNKMKGKEIISEDIVERIVDFIRETAKENKIIVNLFGGEPFIAFDRIKWIIKILREEIGNPIRIMITTNGLLLNDEIIEFIIENEIALSLSWDGCCEANDMNRLDKNDKGTYNRVKAAYIYLKSKGVINLRVRSTFNSKTVKYLLKSAEEFLELDDNMSVFFAPDLFDKEWEEEHINEINRITKILKKHENIDFIGNKNLIHSKCGGGKTSFHIYTDGNIYPCSATVGYREFCIGNIYDGIDKEKSQNILHYSNISIDECKGCAYFDYCQTNKCRIINYILEGDYCKASPIVCAFEKVRINNGIKL